MNILVVGLGSIALKHIKCIRELEPGASIYALRSSQEATPVEGVNSIFSFDEMAVTPDFIMICNPTSKHEETIIQSLKFNCPLFIEKPVLSDTKNAAYINRQIKEKNIITYTACNLRFSPVIVFLKKYLEDHKPRINEINLYCGSYLPDWRPGRDFRKNYSANAALGGGIHLDAIHELDYCTWLFGKPLETRSLKTHNSSLDIDAVDYASYQLRYSEFSANIVLNYYRRDNKRQIEIVTANETIIGDLLSGTVTDLQQNKELFKSPINIQGTYKEQLKYFLENIRNKKQPMNDFTEAVGVLQMVLE